MRMTSGKKRREGDGGKREEVIAVEGRDEKGKGETEEVHAVRASCLPQV